MTFACKTGKHHWIMEEDAQKCCNGYTRCLSIHLVQDQDITVYSHTWLCDAEVEEGRKKMNDLLRRANDPRSC